MFLIHHIFKSKQKLVCVNYMAHTECYQFVSFNLDNKYLERCQYPHFTAEETESHMLSQSGLRSLEYMAVHCMCEACD